MSQKAARYEHTACEIVQRRLNTICTLVGKRGNDKKGFWHAPKMTNYYSIKVINQTIKKVLMGMLGRLPFLSLKTIKMI